MRVAKVKKYRKKATLRPIYGPQEIFWRSNFCTFSVIATLTVSDQRVHTWKLNAFFECEALGFSKRIYFPRIDALIAHSEGREGEKIAKIDLKASIRALGNST